MSKTTDIKAKFRRLANKLGLAGWISIIGLIGAYITGFWVFDGVWLPLWSLLPVWIVAIWVVLFFAVMIWKTTRRR